MKKTKNSGFVLLETLIVSALIVSTLVFVYIEFRNVRNSYETSFKHNTIPGIYMAKELAYYLDDTGYFTLISLLENDSFVDITSPSMVNGDSDIYAEMINDMKIKNVIFTKDDLTSLKLYLKSNNYDKTIFDEEFKSYVMKSEIINKSKYRIIVHFENNTFASILLGTREEIDSEYNAIEIVYTHDRYTNGIPKPVNEVLDELYDRFN